VVGVDILMLLADNLSIGACRRILFFDTVWLSIDMVRGIFDAIWSITPKKGGSNDLGIALLYLFDLSNHLVRYFNVVL